MRIYRAFRESSTGGAQVMVRELGHPERCRALDLRHDLRNHSPDGFQWGYGGSGPAQLALALLCDALGNDEIAERHYQDFKFALLAPLHADTWTMTDIEIRSWIEDREQSDLP